MKNLQRAFSWEKSINIASGSLNQLLQIAEYLLQKGFFDVINSSYFENNETSPAIHTAFAIRRQEGKFQTKRTFA